MGSILFMCYIFFYVLRVRVKGQHSNQLEIDEFIKKMTQATGTKKMTQAIGTKKMTQATGRKKMTQATGTKKMTQATGPQVERR